MKRALCALLLALALVSCARELETDQARLCRMALPALSPPDAALTIDAQREDEDGRGVSVAYRTAADGPRHLAQCRFRRPGRPLHSTELISLSLDGAPLSAPRLYFLIRFWLATPDGRAADPAPLGRIEALPRVSPRAAYALQQALNALPSTAIYALLAAAYSLIYGLVGRINLAFGALAAAGGYGAAFGATLWLGAPPAYVLLSAAALGVAVATGWGVVSGVTALGPLREAPGQQTLVASVGLAIFLSELLRLTQGATPNWVAPILNAPFGVARAGDFVVTTSADSLFSAAVALVAGLALIVAMRWSRFGRDWRAYADDSFAAALFGVDPAAVFLKTFALASALAGLAGFVMTMFYGAVGYESAAPLGLKALVAAILGGIGSIPGALIGGLLLGGFEAVWSAMFPIEYRDVASYALLALLLALRPGGLLGARENSGRRWA
ncbi:MAG: branched-chain amino acid ABC transporter permease [Pseudomonadota bacterium]|nr:branched-chain amino acid ABC transporter permease [Pseudomonadota bacterium]